MFNLDESSPSRVQLLLCMTTILVLLLLWYINTLEQAIYNVGDYTHGSARCDRLDKKMRDELAGTCRRSGEYSVARTAVAKRKRKMMDGYDPEGNVMICHGAGNALRDRLMVIREGLSEDQIPVRSNETSDSQLIRSISSGFDGPQLEGMAAPIDDFERTALLRQNVKKQEIYGEQAHMPSSADSLSELNM